MDEMEVDEEQIRFVVAAGPNDVVVPDLLVERARRGHRAVLHR
jgi:hypothetical protein